MGDAVNVASRLEDSRAPNEILMGPQTYALAGSLFEIEEAGTVTVRGRTQTVQAHRVLGERRRWASAESQARSRLQAPMVGRDRELAVFTGMLGALAQGKGGVVYVLGRGRAGQEPADRRSPQARSPATSTWLEGQAVSLGQNVQLRSPQGRSSSEMRDFSREEDPAERFATT